MKLKLFVLDLELTRRQKALAAGALGVAIALASSVAVAVPEPYTSGDILTAASLNANFADLEQRLSTLEGVPAPELPIVTAWAAYTPTVTAGSVDLAATQTTVAWWRRVGDTVEVRLFTTFSSCPQSGQLQWSLPNGEVPDPAVTVPGEANGSGFAYGPGTAFIIKASIVQNLGSAGVAVDTAGDPGGGATCATVGDGGAIRIAFQLPVLGWTVTGP
jgi:hypothetical protein